MARAIFISYRRDDTEGEAGRLFDDLVHAFGDNSVFMDVAGINPGIDFRKAIDDNVATCGVLLAMIGPEWATIANGDGQRRLDDENDFVRLEIASALKRNIAVIPVLVHDSKMPHPEQLPDNLKDLAYRNSVEISHARWNSDVQLLTKALAPYVASSSATDTEPVHATVSVQLPAPNAPAETPAPAKVSRTPRTVRILLGIAAIIIIAIFFATRKSGHSNSGNSTSAAAMFGKWATPVRVAGNTLARLDISGDGNQLTIHAWGECEGCDWGARTATFDGQKATAIWKFNEAMGGQAEGRVTTLTIAPAGDKLFVRTENTFTIHEPTRRQSEFLRAQ